LRLFAPPEPKESSVYDSLRAPLIVLELIALGAILALIDDPVTRVALGLIVGLLLAYSALNTGQPVEVEHGPEGYDDRRQDHLFRHWVNVLLKKIREYHTVRDGMEGDGVTAAVGQLRMKEVEKQIQGLLSQITESAKPTSAKKGRGALVKEAPPKKIRTYGETARPL
jgi:hypothetical protein